MARMPRSAVTAAPTHLDSVPPFRYFDMVLWSLLPWSAVFMLTRYNALRHFCERAGVQLFAALYAAACSTQLYFQAKTFVDDEGQSRFVLIFRCVHVAVSLLTAMLYVCFVRQLNAVRMIQLSQSDVELRLSKEETAGLYAVPRQRL